MANIPLRCVYCFQIRVTGLLVENDQVLLIKQKVDNNQKWSLPGGRVEAGETLEAAIIREIYKETGLLIEVVRNVVNTDAEKFI